MVRSRFLSLWLIPVLLLIATAGQAVEFSVLHELADKRFREPVDAAVDFRGFFYLLDKGRKSVFLVSQHGEVLKEVRLPSSVRRPEGIAVRRPGVFFIADSVGGVVHEVEVSGKCFGEFKIPGAGRIMDVAFFGKRVFIIDGSKHRFYVYDTEGRKIAEVGKKGGKPGEFRFPYRVDLDGSGRVYVSDVMNGRVQAFDVEGKHLFTIKSFGLSERNFVRPGGVASYDANRVLITDLLSGLVYEWDGQSGILEALRGKNGPLRFSYPSSITCSRLGDVGVVDRRAKKFFILRQISE